MGRWVSSRWVGGSVGKWLAVGWSVVGGFNKIRRNNIKKTIIIEKAVLGS